MSLAESMRRKFCARNENKDKMFLSWGMDALVIGSFVVEK